MHSLEVLNRPIKDFHDELPGNAEPMASRCPGMNVAAGQWHLEPNPHSHELLWGEMLAYRRTYCFSCREPLRTEKTGNVEVQS